MAKKQKSQYRKELEAEVKPMLREANMKLLNIEQLSKQEGFEGVEEYAYRVAMKNIRQLRGEEFKRFNLPANIHQLEKTKRALETFLGSATSSKKGIIGVYEQNAASLNEKFGSNFSWQQMGDFLRAANFEKLKADYDSDTAVIMLKALYENKNLTKEAFKDMLQKHQVNTEYDNKGLDEVDSDTLAKFVDADVSWDELFPVE